MDVLEIYWTRTAVLQRDHIFEYWINRTDSKDYSIKLNRLIQEKLDVLKDHPFTGKHTSYGSHRMISLKHYSIIYLIEGERIYITGFWDNRQDPKKLYDLLKEK
jgi:addiction module RelE/StbE family toxin